MELLSLKKKGLSADGIQPFLFVFIHHFYSSFCIFFLAKCRLKNEILTCRNKMYHEPSKKYMSSCSEKYDNIFCINKLERRIKQTGTSPF